MYIPLQSQHKKYTIFCAASRFHTMPHKSPKISQYSRFPSPSWSGSTLENIKIPTYSHRVTKTNAKPTRRPRSTA